MSDKKSSNVRLVKAFDGHDRSGWPEVFQWLAEHISRLENAFSKHLDRLNQERKTRTDSS